MSALENLPAKGSTDWYDHYESMDVLLRAIEDDYITSEDGATDETAGIIKVADETELGEGTSNTTAVSPYGLVSTVASLIAAAVDEIEAVADAASISVLDADEYYVGETVEEVLAELNPGNFLSSTNGGLEALYTHNSVSGPIVLDLAEGSVQRVITDGEVILSVDPPTTSKVISFTLVYDCVNNGDAVTWFSDITWMSGLEEITWVANTRRVFSFISLDSGLHWLGWHLTPTPTIQSQTYSVSGGLSDESGQFRLYNDSLNDRKITSVRASVGTAPTGSSLIVDVNKGGTTIYTTQANRPTISVSGYTSKTVPDVSTWGVGEYLTVDIDQVGSTVSGSDLTVTVSYQGI